MDHIFLLSDHQNFSCKSFKFYKDYLNIPWRSFKNKFKTVQFKIPWFLERYLWRVFTKILFFKLFLPKWSWKIIMKNQKEMVLVGLSRCNLVNPFILKTNSTITQRRFWIIAKKRLVIIMIVAELAPGFFTFNPWSGDQERRWKRFWKISWGFENLTGL